jgi:GLPGLI family protein
LSFKAITTIKSNELSLNVGRNQQNRTANNEVASAARDIVIEAWYTPEIPVNNGPGDYWGLPGLIVEVNADRTTLQLVKVDLNPKERIQIKEPDKGKVVTKKEFDEIAAAKMEEMRQNFQGGRQQGNEHRIQIRM